MFGKILCLFGLLAIWPWKTFVVSGNDDDEYNYDEEDDGFVMENPFFDSIVAELEESEVEIVDVPAPPNCSFM